MPRTKFTDAAQREMLHPWASCTKGPLTFGDYKTHTHLLQCSSLQTSSPRWLSSPQLRWPLCSPIVTFQACGLGASGQGEGGRGQAVPPPAAHCPPQGPMKPCPERGALSMEHLVIKMGGKKQKKLTCNEVKESGLQRTHSPGARPNKRKKTTGLQLGQIYILLFVVGNNNFFTWSS